MNFLYPSARFDEEFEFTEAKSIKEMKTESVYFDRNSTIEEFLGNNTVSLSTFQDVFCPNCYALLEDDEKVLRLQCNCTYHKDCLEKILKDGDDNCPKCGDGIIPKVDLENAEYVETVN
jgi:hypothetical protein